MAKFDVYRSPDGRGYLIDCQSDLLRDLNTRFVVPLVAVEEAPKPAARLNPLFEIEGASCVMVTQFAAAIGVSELKAPVGTLADDHLTVGSALDMLISGF